METPYNDNTDTKKPSFPQQVYNQQQQGNVPTLNYNMGNSNQHMPLISSRMMGNGNMMIPSPLTLPVNGQNYQQQNRGREQYGNQQQGSQSQYSPQLPPNQKPQGYDQLQYQSYMQRLVSNYQPQMPSQQTQGHQMQNQRMQNLQIQNQQYQSQQVQSPQMSVQQNQTQRLSQSALALQNGQMQNGTGPKYPYRGQYDQKEFSHRQETYQLEAQLESMRNTRMQGQLPGGNGNNQVQSAHVQQHHQQVSNQQISNHISNPQISKQRIPGQQVSNQISNQQVLSQQVANQNSSRLSNQTSNQIPNHSPDQHMQRQVIQNHQDIQAPMANSGAVANANPVTQSDERPTIVTKMVAATVEGSLRKKRGRPKKLILDPETNEFIDSSHEHYKRLNKLLMQTTADKTSTTDMGKLIQKGSNFDNLNDQTVKQLLEQKDRRGRPRKFPIEQTGVTIRGIRVNGTLKARKKPSLTAYALPDQAVKKKRGRPRRQQPAPRD